MKKHILGFALIAAMIGSIATGCSSQKKAGDSDTTMKDTSKLTAPADTMKKDTAMKKDTMKKDTTHH
jgi:pentapeptide MXKDX repeat protein